MIINNTQLSSRQNQALWKKAAAAGSSRNEFLTKLHASGASGVLDECAKKGGLVSTKPARAEMPFELLAEQDYFTPNSLFFTFCHASPPQIDILNWKLTIEGDGVENPITLTYDDLLNLPSKTFTRYLECAGNGRSFYESMLNKKALGPQWHFGGYGIAEWTGVPLGELLQLAKVKPSAVQVMPVGLDDPPGERPIPLAKAMEEDSLLVYLMNNEILPVDHGFPARVFLPGWIGVASVKWVGKLVVSTTPLHVATNTSSYVFIGPDYQPQPPARGPVLSKQVIKSACCLPWPAVLRAGQQRIVGVAWSPSGKIAKVEVSLDGGQVFEPTRLTGPNIKRAGTKWEYSFDAGPGPLTITPRATDELGNTQYPISQQKWNQLGYIFGALVPHPVTITP